MKKLIIVFLLLPLICTAQSYKDYLRKGNKLYEQKKYNDAEINYLKSLDKKKNSDKSVFNIGDALYKQEQYDKAAEKFNDLTNRNLDKETRAMAYHNLGNSLLKDKKKQDQQQQQQQEQNDKNQQNQQKQQQPKISKQDAQRMLQALANEEKNLQKKLNKQVGTGRVKTTKPW